MSCFLLIWILWSVILALLVCCRCTHVVYIVALVPIISLGLFFLLRHYPSTDNHREEFFGNFVIGGHRGSPHHAPENSLSAIQMAVEEGCQLVEFDIQLSADFVAVLMHDGDTGRVSETKIPVKSSSSKMLFDIELKAVNGVNDSIPSLIQVVDWCKEKNIKMIIDVKEGDTKIISEIVRLINDKNLYSLIVVTSFNPMVPYLIKWHDNRILTGFTSRRSYYSMETEALFSPRGHILYQWLLEILDTLTHIGIETLIYPRFLGIDMLLLNHRDVSIELATQARQFNIHIVAWTVNEEIEMHWLRDVAKIPFLTDAPYKVK